MPDQTPKVSVIIAAYRPGDAVNRVIESLDAQTLPQEEFEVIFVDDGSPDDTFARLQRIASARPNMQVFQIANSGWPSRPRNVGIDHAHGEYVLFMDHDDSLYPDGLRRAYEYASENNADLLAFKECKTNDVWWGMPSQRDGNIANAVTNGGIDRLQPMMPHKLYRRQLLNDHHIRFPEGARVLWEDVYINVHAYRDAKVVSVLADTPVYLWHASDANTSHTFDPTRIDFWDRLEDMMDFVSATLSGPENHQARLATVAWEVGNRIIHRCTRLIGNPDPTNLEARTTALSRARRLLDRYVSDDVYARLPKKQQALVHLIGTGDMDLVKSFHDADAAITAHVRISSTQWDDGGLQLDTIARWEPKDPAVPAFRIDGHRTVLAVDAALERAIPPELLDLSEDAALLAVDLSVRGRAEHVTWALPSSADEARYEPNEAGALSIRRRDRSRIELNAAALGRPLEDTVWDVRMRTGWIGMERRGPLLFDGPVSPALLHGRCAVAYSNASRGLTLDLAQRLRTLAIDAEPRSGPAGAISAFSAPLENVAVFGDTTVDAAMVSAVLDGAIPDELSTEQKSKLLINVANSGFLGAKVVADAAGVRFEGSAALPRGTYTLYARREGTLHRTKRSLVIDEAGQTQFA